MNPIQWLMRKSSGPKLSQQQVQQPQSLIPPRPFQRECTPPYLPLPQSPRPFLQRQSYGAKYGSLSNEATSKQEESLDYYLTFTGSFMAVMGEYPEPLVLTANQAETLMRYLAEGIRVSCNLVTPLGVPVAEAMFSIRTPKGETPPISSDLQTPTPNGRAGEHYTINMLREIPSGIDFGHINTCVNCAQAWNRFASWYTKHKWPQDQEVPSE